MPKTEIESKDYDDLLRRFLVYLPPAPARQLFEEIRLSKVGDKDAALRDHMVALKAAVLRQHDVLAPEAYRKGGV